MHYREWVVSAGRPSTDARQTLRRAGIDKSRRLMYADNTLASLLEMSDYIDVTGPYFCSSIRLWHNLSRHAN